MPWVYEINHIYHKHIKYTERNEDMIRRDWLSTELLSKDMSQFWISVSDWRGKGKWTSEIIDDCANDNDVSKRFFLLSLVWKVFNQVGLTVLTWMNCITIDIGNNCTCDSECHKHVISSFIIHGAIQLLNSGNNDWFDALTSEYLLNPSPLLYEYLSFLYTYIYYLYSYVQEVHHNINILKQIHINAVGKKTRITHSTKIQPQ